MNKIALKLALWTGGSLICGFIFKVLEISLIRNKNKDKYSVVNELRSIESEDKKRTIEMELSNVLCLILSASSTVDVCVPSLDSDAMAECLLLVQQKNKAKVRIAIHDSDDFHNLQLFAKSGIQVKVIKQGVRLAYEFVLLDEARALLGAPHPDALLVGDATVVATLSREFERVWNSVTDLPYDRLTVRET